MGDTREYSSVEAMLRALSGGVLDFKQLESDMDGVLDFVRFQQKLWDVELKFSPATVFSAAWDDINLPQSDREGP